jgi:hypothetical protein
MYIHFGYLYLLKYSHILHFALGPLNLGYGPVNDLTRYNGSDALYMLNGPHLLR